MAAWSLWFGGGGKEWLDPGYISKVELTGFADELDMWERKEARMLLGV